MRVLNRKEKRNKGYTLAEVLLAVAIILILMAIAVPAFFAIRKNLRQKALDHKAEIIYMAVQNNLTKLRSNGSSAQYGVDKATKMNVIPMDSDGEKTLYYVTADQKNAQTSAASVIVTEDTVDAELYQHYWVAEYDPTSASVYAVFYSEKRKDYEPAAYNSLRYKKNRLKDGARVGYYGGDSVESGNTSALAPKITVKNEEKLQVIINSKRPDDNPLSFDVRMTDTAGHTLTLKYGTDSSGKNLTHKTDDLHLADTSGLDRNNETGTIRGNNYTLTLTLDALQPLGSDENAASRFAELYGKNTQNAKLKTLPDSQLTPGTGLHIEVTVHSDSSMVEGLSAVADTNSLFGDNSTQDQADILYGRHLQNLDQETSGVTDAITSAVQKSDIHFEKRDDLEEDQTDIDSWYSCYGELAFHPITNQQLISYQTQISSLRISHLTTEAAEKAGLFAVTPANMMISGVHLESSKIISNHSEHTYAGALVAYAGGAITVDDCQIWLNPTDLEGKTEKDLWIDGAAVQGGLVGCARGLATITNSLAATVMGTEDSIYTGGLIGQAQGGAVLTGSYADSYLSGQTTGGLIAQLSGQTTIQSCYVAGYQKAVKVAGGFLAEASAQTKVSNSYTAVTWLKADQEGADTVRRYSVMPKKYASVTDSTYFLDGGTDYTADEKTNEAVGKKVSYPELSNLTRMAEKLNMGGIVKFGSAAATTPYNLKNQGLSSYSYPALAELPHYGDWQASFEAGSLVYYEIYQEDGSCGFFGGNITPSLRTDQTVVGDGYGIVYSEEQKPDDVFTVTYQKLTQTGTPEDQILTIDPTKKEVVSYSVTVDETDYIIYPLPSEIVNAASQKDAFYQKLVISGEAATGDSQEQTGEEDTVTGNIFYYNPHFAKTVITTGDDVQKLTVPNTISIRTARQLYALSSYYAKYAGVLTNKKTFIQELDIDYAAYEWTTYADTRDAVTVQKPIGEKEAFTANYDGQYHKVQNISFASDENRVGFIGENAGTVQNLFLVSDYQMDKRNSYLKYEKEITGNQTVYMGVLAGVNSGQIQNCAVSGYCTEGNKATLYIRQNGTLYFGGLTGKNAGVIRNCEADTPLVNANILYGKAYISGFSGENASTGKITGSYAIGKVKVEYSKGEKSMISGFTAKNAGYLNNNYCAVALTAAGSTDTCGFSPKGGNIRNCDYLSGGTFRYLGNMESYENTSGSGTARSYDELKQKEYTRAECHSATSSQEGYPFSAVVKNASKEKVHFGNWQLDSDLGSFGVIYWEKEEQGSNNGYHFSYIGYTEDATSPEDTLYRISGDTLCQEHDDGGIVTRYGYGYYYRAGLDETEKPIPQARGFQTGTENKEVSEELSKRLDGFEVRAFTTAASVGTTKKDTDSYMKMTSGAVNGVWSIQDPKSGKSYDFTISPFFANAMQYGVEDTGEILAQELTVLAEDGSVVTGKEPLAMPGTDSNPYEIRSAAQLQYLNWNSKTGDAITMLDAENYLKTVNYYTYLGQMLGAEGSQADGEKEYRWTGKEVPKQQRYVLNSEEKCRQNKYKDYYINVKDNCNQGYWEFVRDASGKSCQVKEWEINRDHVNSWLYGHMHYKCKETTDTGYWKWIGSGEPSDGTTSWIQVGEITDGKISVLQTHDVNANRMPDKNGTDKTHFTQIGSLFDTEAANHTANANAYIAYFAGKFDGNTYSIKNVEIHSTNALVGLFGAVIGAKVQNITLYSDKGNYIQRSAQSPKSWYAIGGMCGLAGVGKGNQDADTTIVNCTVSGYTIRDNSTRSAWGDGNVGGMFGISTMNIQQCTAVNTIELNCNFMGNGKNDGVSVRTGGLAGSMRGELTMCYTGGEIRCTEECYANARTKKDTDYTRYKEGAKIFMGGLTGGIYLKDGGNLGTLLGDHILGFSDYPGNTGKHNGKVCNTPTTIISNCYTYIELPGSKEQVDKIYSIQPIGSNGETPNENDNNRHTRVKIQNCYYYGNNITHIEKFTAKNAGSGPDDTNIDETAISISWDQMSGKEQINGQDFLDCINTGIRGKGFGTVTTKDANGKQINGKYTFPGSRTDLDGMNYPFPTILEQGAGSESVNVHYGEWQLKGLYWEESRADMDIFESLNPDGGEEKKKAVKTFILKDASGIIVSSKEWDDFEFVYGYEEDTVIQNISEEAAQTDHKESSILKAQDSVAEVLDIHYDSTVGGYIAAVWAHKTGTEVITAVTTGTDGQTYRASFTLTVTADLTAYADSASVSMKNKDTVILTLHAVPMTMYTGSDADQLITADQQNDMEYAETVLMQNGEVITGVDSTVGSGQSESLAMSEESTWNADEEPETAEDVDRDDESEEVSDSEIQLQDQAEKTEISEAIIMPYAESDHAETESQTDLAPYMDWKVELEDGGEDYLSVSEVKALADSQQMQFTISCHADLEADTVITLTITGTYIYEDVDYTVTTWVEVIPQVTSVQIVDDAGNLISADTAQERDTVLDGSTADDSDVTEDTESANDVKEPDVEEADTEIASDETKVESDAVADNPDSIPDETDSSVILEHNSDDTITESGTVIGIE